MDHEERKRLEQRLDVLTRRIAESYDGYALSGPCVMKWARELGEIRRELERIEREERVAR